MHSQGIIKMTERVELFKDWKLKTGSPASLPENVNFPDTGIAAIVPGTVHTDLSDERYIFVARLIDKSGKEICRECYFAGKWKHARLKNAIINKKISERTNGFFLTLTSDRLAIYVTLVHPEMSFADNALILLPKEKVPVRIIDQKPLQSKIDEIDILTLNQFLT